MTNPNDLAIAVCHFNWCNFDAPVRNLNRFIRYMESRNIPVYGVELSLTGTFATIGKKNWKQIKVNSNNVCFQKEACINLVEKLIPADYSKIAWIDHDIFFANDNWYGEASKKLESTKMIQLFDTYISTDFRGEEIYRKPCCVSDITSIGSSRNYVGKSGVAWAARREFWKNGGLFPFSVMGGGDTILEYTIFDNIYLQSTWTHFVNISGERFINWKRGVIDYIGNSVSNISGEVFHEWHGSLEGKAYRTRHALVKQLNLDSNIILNDDGLIEFVDVSDSFKLGMLEYFKNRDEDGT